MGVAMAFYLLVFITLVVLGVAMGYAYRTTRDPLHPIIYLAPLCIYSYAFKPLLLDYMGVLSAFFDPEQFLFVQAINTLGVAAFAIGALTHVHKVIALRSSSEGLRAHFEGMLDASVRGRVLGIALGLGGLAVIGYWLMIYMRGGPAVVYGQAYGGIRAATGYLNELPLLCLSAIGLLYLAWAGRGFTLGRILLLAVVASPLLIHGLLGARRGPTFMVLAALILGGFLVSPRRPRLITIVVTVFCLGVLILFLVSNRNRIYLGASALQEWRTGSSRNVVTEITAGDDWVYSGGTILTSNHLGFNHWGSRFAVIFFVRPIPRQVWPTKYEDLGFAWLEHQDDMGGMTDREWIGVVGWRPSRGSAAGFVADLFLEFSYLGIFACYGFGRIYSYLWKQCVLERGAWLILYLFAVVLSVYVPTQSVSAWLHRFCFLAIPTVVLWYLLVRPVLSTNAGGPPNALPPSRGRRIMFTRPKRGHVGPATYL